MNEPVTIEVSMVPTFTHDELYEIEKVMDVYRGVNAQQMAAMAEKFGNTKLSAGEKMAGIIIDAAISQHEMYSRIAEKASAIRKRTLA